MVKFFYVYILQSELDAERFYTGLTDNLIERFRSHNAGRVLHTAKWRPWRLKAYVGLRDRVRAADFERYLKSSSGRAFVKKRL
jgi:predicted GIY-YIG superfamily endonuclease